MEEETGEEIEEEAPPELEGMKAYYDALWEAQAEAPRVIRGDEKFEGPGQWRFASHKTYERLLIPILLDNNLVLELADVGPPDDLELPTAAGGTQWMTTLECVFRVVHPPSGYAQVYRIRGRRTNDADKGVSHGVASATKTMLQRLLNVCDMEDAPDNPVQISQGSRTTKAGQRKPRKLTTAADHPPPPQDQKPPTPESQTETPAQRLELAKANIKKIFKENHLRLYHLEALARTQDRLPDILEEWGLPDYLLAQELLQENINVCEKAMDEIAQEFPTDANRKRKLHVLIGKLADEGMAISGEERILTAAAHTAGWSDAVEFWIDKLTLRIQGQTEADV